MELDSTETGRDPRLDHALHLLKKPKRAPPSLLAAVAASAGLAGAALLLAITMVFRPGADEAIKSRTNEVIPTQPAATSSAPGFELSSSSISADAPKVRDAVIIGTESQ